MTAAVVVVADFGVIEMPPTIRLDHSTTFVPPSFVVSVNPCSCRSWCFAASHEEATVLIVSSRNEAAITSGLPVYTSDGSWERLTHARGTQILSSSFVDRDHLSDLVSTAPRRGVANGEAIHSISPQLLLERMRIHMCSERLACYAWVVLCLSCLGSSHAFLPPTSLMSPKTSRSKTSSTHRNCGWLNTRQLQQQFMNPRLQLFRKDDAPKSEETSNGKEGKSSGGGFFDFLSGFGKKNEAAVDESKSTPPSKQVNNDSKQEDAAVAVAVAEKEVATSTATTTETSSSTTTTSSPVDEAPKEVDAAERSRQLKAQAERLRLEAERMDAELTLEKIARLERELAAAQRAKERHQDDDDKDGPNGRTSSKSSDKVEEIQREMEALRAKIRGEKPPAPTVRKAATTSVDQTKPRVMPVETHKPGMTVKIELPSKLPMPGPFSQENFDRICNDLKDSPDFVKKLMANLVELDYENAADMNVTEIAVRMEQLERMDLSFSRRPLPEFTDEDIARAKEDIRFNSWYKDVLVMLETDQDRAELIKSNETELALRALAYEFYMEDKEIEIAKLSPGESFFEGLIEGSIDQTIETLYPKCMRKEGSVEPTLAEVQKLVSDILPKASFVPSEKPEKVLGGYIVRGSSRASNGDALIAAIEREISKSQLQDKLNVFYAKDFTMFAKASEKALNSDDMEAVDLDELPPILYVTTRDVARQPRRVALTLVTALGVATSWYLSVYPFLLNNGIMARVDEQITLADSNMAYDLSWLTDLSLPLFISFMGIQVTHEIGHRLAAGLYNVSEHDLSQDCLSPALLRLIQLEFPYPYLVSDEHVGAHIRSVVGDRNNEYSDKLQNATQE